MSSVLADTLNAMERRYFFERSKTGFASKTAYIAGNTWRAWQASPKIEGAVVQVLRAAFDEFVDRFKQFYGWNSSVNRKAFDEYHSEEIEHLVEFTRRYNRNAQIHPSAAGECHGYAYNSYAKVLNLIHTHWFFRLAPNSMPPRINYPPSDHPDLVTCCHVPLDTQVLAGLRRFVESGLLPRPPVLIPNGGMGSVRSKEHYYDLQYWLRSVVDSIPSTNFPGQQLSPLAFEAFWEG